MIKILLLLHSSSSSLSYSYKTISAQQSQGFYLTLPPPLLQVHLPNATASNGSDNDEADSALGLTGLDLSSNDYHNVQMQNK